VLAYDGDGLYGAACVAAACVVARPLHLTKPHTTDHFFFFMLCVIRACVISARGIRHVPYEHPSAPPHQSMSMTPKSSTPKSSTLLHLFTQLHLILHVTHLGHKTRAAAC
jgi:hypothetical protein